MPPHPFYIIKQTKKKHNEIKAVIIFFQFVRTAQLHSTSVGKFYEHAIVLIVHIL